MIEYAPKTLSIEYNALNVNMHMCSHAKKETFQRRLMI